MKPQDQIVVDGTRPGEGGFLEIDHNPPPPAGTLVQPGQGGLKPFDDQFVKDIDKANNYQDQQAQDAAASVPNQKDDVAPPPMQGQSAPNYSQNQATLAAKNVLDGADQPPEPLQPFNSSIAPPQSRLQLNNQTQNGMYSTNPNNVGPPPGPVMPVSGGVEPPSGPPANINSLKPPKNPKSKKKWLLILLPILILLIVGGVVLAVYQANTPGSVWSTGMGRSGKQVTAFVNKLAQPEQFKTYDQAQIKVAGQLEQNGQTLDINFDSLLNNKQSDSNFGLKTAATAGDNLNISADVITNLPDGANYPDVYFKVAGLQALGLDVLWPELGKYNDKWVAIEQDFIKQTEAALLEPAQGTDQQAELSYEDFVSLAQDTNQVLQQYIFTANPEFAVINQTEFVATEQSEGITANHYKANISKQNYINFCTALVQKISANTAVKRLANLPEDQYSRQVIEATEDCQTQADNIKTDKSFDIWIDKKNKLFHKVRLYEDVLNQPASQDILQQARYEECVAIASGQTADCQYLLTNDIDSEQNIDVNPAYIELGQVYKGGDNFMFFANYKQEQSDSSTDGRLELNINASTLAFDGAANLTIKAGKDTTKLNITMASEPYNGEINSAKPSGAVPVQQLFKALTGQENPFVSVKQDGRDSERRLEISKLNRELEVYYAKNGFYPALKDLNDSAFRQANFSALKEADFVDPGGASGTLNDRVGPNVYAYVVVPSGCDNKRLPCSYFELSAQLEDGQIYTKQSIN